MNEAERSFEAAISTETPVEEFDWNRGEYVPRILLSDGVVLPDSRQVPFLDSHLRGDGIQRQLGSVRNIRIEPGEVAGRLHFSSAEEDAFVKVREGHITDVSAGFNVREETYIAAGQTDIVAGREYTGPVNVATKWELREVSLVPIGADEAAKIRGFNPSKLSRRKRDIDLPQGNNTMPATVTRDEHVRQLKAMSAAFNHRCLQGAAIESPEPTNSDWRDFQYASLLDMARECLFIGGASRHEISGLTNQQIAERAMGAAGHTTGAFTILTQDAFNKTLQTAYGEAPSTWEGPMRRGASVADFKDIHRTRLGAVPNLPDWLDNTAPEETQLVDAQETYAVEAKSTKISFSWRLIVNDDLDALSRTPAMLGTAARRTVNVLAWSVLTNNALMQDGQPLFVETPLGLRHQSNLTTGVGVPSVSTLGTIRAKMRTVRGENTPEGGQADDVLNLTPAYLVVPASLETVADQLVNSIADISQNNSITHNPFRSLTPVVEPLLDANSETAWYAFASPNQIDTVEVTFLQGQESPNVRDWIDPQTLSQNFAVVQTFGAKAINWRGIQKHAGA